LEEAEGRAERAPSFVPRREVHTARGAQERHGSPPRRPRVFQGAPMKPVPLLSEIDDEKHYAQLLEVAYCEAATELNVLLHEMSWLRSDEDLVAIDMTDSLEWLNKLKRLQWVMIGTVGDSTERRRRLADVARGLADGVLDEEGA
jgi:hypothetical protein